MAPRTTQPTEPVEETLEDDDYWTQLVTENVIPPMRVKGIVLRQPSAGAVEAWEASGQTDDKLILGEQHDAIQELFKAEPLSAKKNFYRSYMKHMFGIEGDALKG